MSALLSVLKCSPSIFQLDINGQTGAKHFCPTRASFSRGCLHRAEHLEVNLELHVTLPPPALLMEHQAASGLDGRHESSNLPNPNPVSRFSLAYFEDLKALKGNLFGIVLLFTEIQIEKKHSLFCGAFNKELLFMQQRSACLCLRHHLISLDSYPTKSIINNTPDYSATGTITNWLLCNHHHRVIVVLFSASLLSLLTDNQHTEDPTCLLSWLIK